MEKFKLITLATHASDINGTPDALKQYLLKNSEKFIEFRFPINISDHVKPSILVYEDEKVIFHKKINLILKPFILNYIKDILIVYIFSIWFFFKYGKSSIYFGCNNFLAFAGIFLKKILFAKVIFYSADYSDKRFGNIWLNSIYLWVDKLAVRFSDFTWSNTNRTRAIRKKQGIKKSSNILTPNGVFTSEIKKEEDAYLHTPKIKIEYHGYISESKGVQNVILALEKIGNPNFLFDIRGYGPFTEEILKLIANSKFKENYRYLGKVSISEILAKVPNYDLSVALINEKEDYIRFCDPMKVKESLACQVPVLISNVPEVASTIAGKGLGLVVKSPEDIDEIAEKLSLIFENPEKLLEFKENISKFTTNLDWNYIFGKALQKVSSLKKYTVVPNLLTIKSNLSKIPGFYFAEKLDFYPYDRKKTKLNYKIIKTEKIDIPTSYSFRNGYYFKTEDSWYYYRKIFFLEFKLRFLIKEKTFLINPSYLKLVPFEIGSIWPAGKLIADFISLDLFLNNIDVVHGCGVSINNRQIVLIGLGFNGKTTFVKKAIQIGGKYISEDLAIVDLEKKLVYPTSPFSLSSNFAREVNKNLSALLDKSNIIKIPKSIDKLFLIQNSTDSSLSKSDLKFIDFLLPASLAFFRNNFTRTIIMEAGLMNRIFDRIALLKEKNGELEYINLYNYNFEKIFENLNEK